MVECLATAGSCVEVTNYNTITMTKKLPEKKKSTTQGQATEIARPAEGLIITAAKLEKNKDAKEDMPVVLPAIPDVYNTQKATVEAGMIEEWPEEDSDKEMEAEMIKLQMEHE